MERYSEYKDSGVKWLGEIPGHWEVLAMKHILKLKKEIVGKRSSQYDLLSLTLKGVVKRDMDNPEGKFPASFDTYQIVEPNDFIFCNFDNEETPRAVGLSEYKGMITGAYDVLYRNNSKLTDKFLIYYFLYIDDAKRFKPLYKGLRKTVPFDSFMAYKIPVPTLNEQNAIVNYLDSATSKIDEAIAQQQKMIDLLNERKQIIINNAVTKGLDPNVKMKPSGVDWIGDIPEHWEVVKTSYIFNHIGSGTTPKSGQEDYYSEDGHYFLQTGDLNNGYIEDTSKKITDKALRGTKLKIYPKGSLVIAMYGATIGKLGILNINTTVNQACCVLPESKSMITRYAFYSLMVAKNDLILQSRGGGQPNISQDTIKNEKLMVPPLDEQYNIIDYIDKKCIPIQTSIDTANKQISLLQERKQIIINDVVTGKVKVI